MHDGAKWFIKAYSWAIGLRGVPGGCRRLGRMQLFVLLAAGGGGANNAHQRTRFPLRNKNKNKSN